MKSYQKFAEIYDKLMNQQEFYDAYYAFISKLIVRGQLLEIGCGTGNLAKVLQDNGYSIEGIDISAHMLRQARRKGIKVHLQNMADFKLKRRFDAILCVFDSLNYLKDEIQLERCFSSVRNHLRPGGLFIFDLNSSYKIRNIVRLFGKKTKYIVGKTSVVWTNASVKGRWIAELQLTSSGRTYFERHAETAFSLQDTEKLLKKSGFEIIRAVSDFEFSPISRTSLKWFFVCRKKE